MAEMKDSGTTWLGMIPKDWELSKISSIYELRMQKVSDKDYPPLSVTMNGIVPQLASAAKTNAHDDRKLVKKGDFAINSRSDRRGSCGVSEYDGSVSLINTVMKPRDEMNPDYYNWLFHTMQFADEFYKWGHGIVDDLWTTNWQDMKHIDIPVPTLDEQRVIADYLNKAISEIDALHTDIEKQIGTLEEYKKSIITEAVTKGLDPDAEMKDSGIEWIGKIPKNWKTNKIKYLFTSGKGLSITKENLIDEGLPVISYGQIHAKTNSGVDINKDLLQFVSYEYQKRNPNCEVKKFDFIFADTSEDYEGCGNGVYKRDNSILFAGYHSIILRAINQKDNRYLAYLFLTDLWRKQIRETASGVKVFSVTQKNLINSSIILPPEDEQNEIANYLDVKCNKIDSIIVDKKKQLETLEQYKKSLIYEYVTGKKEVLND
jgi:type I restriction enzyme S subunit